MADSARVLHRYQYADYLELEQDSPIKHEYFAGEIFAMAGGTPEHAAMAMAIAVALGRQLGRECRLFSSDLRVRVLATGLTTYPDLTVVCGAIQRDPESPTTVVNPTFLVEVMSPSTEEYDRGEKLTHYQQIPGLRGCLLVAHDRREFALWTPSDEGGPNGSEGIEQQWQSTLAGSGETLKIPSLHCELVVDELYDGILPSL